MRLCQTLGLSVLEEGRKGSVCATAKRRPSAPSFSPHFKGGKVVIF